MNTTPKPKQNSSNTPATKAYQELVLLVGEETAKLWWTKWVGVSETTQTVINRKYLDSEHHDTICELLVKSMSESLIENNAIDFTIDNTRYSSKIHFIKEIKC